MMHDRACGKVEVKYTAQANMGLDRSCRSTLHISRMARDDDLQR